MKIPQKKSNQTDERLIFNPEYCVVCGSSLGDAELGTMICIECRRSQSMFAVRNRDYIKKSNKEVKS